MKENNYLRDNYHFKFISWKSQHLVDEIDSNETLKKPISDISWYNILANPAYARAFNYYTVSVRDRVQYIVDDDSDEDNNCEQSDMVSILINMAYCNKEVARSFELSPGFSKTLGAEIAQAKYIWTYLYF